MALAIQKPTIWQSRSLKFSLIAILGDPRIPAVFDNPESRDCQNVSVPIPRFLDYKI